MSKKHTVKELEKLYREAKSADRTILSEMRTNLLLVSGEHYAKANSKFINRVRNMRGISEEQRIRLVKNHTQVACKRYANHIISGAPGVVFSPQNEKEFKDKKDAQIDEAIWKWVKNKHDFDEKNDEWVDDFVNIGEVLVKITWDPNVGEVVGYNQATDDDGEPLWEEDDEGNKIQEVDEMGMPVFSELGEPVYVPKKGMPIYTGGFNFEEVYGLNLWRDPAAKSMKKARYMGLDKMSDVDDLKLQFPDKADKIKEMPASSMEVFDFQNIGTDKNAYTENANETVVKEVYFKKCHQYPQGYYYIWCGDDLILDEGELPGGIFPLVYQYAERVQTCARGISPVIRVGRPFQAEINRMSSKIAEHHITLGDDKILMHESSTLSDSEFKPGLRAYKYSGAEPKHFPGRDGAQYVPALQATISEFYKVLEIDESEDKQSTEPFAMLFRSASQKKRFKRYINRYERYLKNVARTTMELAKLYMPEDIYIKAAGSCEAINIQEFKEKGEIESEVRIEAQSEDLETKFGRQLFISQVLQYVGGKLDNDTIGKYLRSAPFANTEEVSEDLTIKGDTAMNEILALDRGEIPFIPPLADHKYIMDKLSYRMSQADFRILSPEIQQNYDKAMSIHNQHEIQKIRAMQEAQAGFIPVDGYLVTCDMYAPTPGDPTKSKRIKVPYGALSWLVKRLETQGYALDELERLSSGTQQVIAEGLNASGPAPQAMPPMGVSQPQMA